MNENKSPSGLKIGFIGAGNMAEAMIGAVLRAGQAAAADIRISDISRERTSQLQKQYGVIPAPDNAAVMAACDLVVLAVKPQVMDAVLRDLSGSGAFSKRSARRVLVSIAAGIPLSRIESVVYAGTTEAERRQMPLFRVMPNTPALVGAGMSGICANAYAEPSDTDLVKQLLAPTGQVMVFDEAEMDAVTAMSGSGPAYGFYVLEAMIEAGGRLGLSRQDAAALARAALSGALALMEHQQETPESLRARVSSPGGTTEAAIGVLEKNCVKEAFIEAIAAAAQRARELSNPPGNP